MQLYLKLQSSISLFYSKTTCLLKCGFFNRDLSVINPVWYYIYVALGEVSKINVLTSKVPYLMILRSKKEKKKKKKDADGKSNKFAC